MSDAIPFSYERDSFSPMRIIGAGALTGKLKTRRSTLPVHFTNWAEFAASQGIGASFWLASVPRVHIVDPSGSNADAFTTWAAAIAAAVDGDTIIIASQLDEAGVVLKFGVKTIFLSPFGISTSQNGPIFTCPTGVSAVVAGIGRTIIAHLGASTGPSVLISGTGDLKLHGMYFSRNSANDIIEMQNTSRLEAEYCVVENDGAGAAISSTVSGTKTIQLETCKILGGDAGIDIQTGDATNYIFNNSYIHGRTITTGIGFSLFVGGGSSSYVQNCTFEGDANSVSVSALTWSSAPFYRNNFIGATNQLTVDVPVADGSNWNL